MRKTQKAESSAAASSERRNWGNVFNLMVKMVRSQQNQLLSFANRHEFLEERLRMQHEGWASDVRIHRDQISQMKGVLRSEEKKRLFEAAKADLTQGLKQREASVLKWILENTEDELADFKAWFEYLSHKSSNGETLADQGTAFKDSRKKSTRNSAEKDKSSREIKDELRRLKVEYESLAVEKSSEVASLLAEKNFVWNQYNIMENNYTDKLRSKQAEVEKANEKIQVLVSSMELLQSVTNEKDRKISELESKVVDMEAETKRLNEEISGLSVELESLRKLKNVQVTPVLNHCTEKTKMSGSGTIKSRSGRNRTLNKERCTPNVPAPARSSESDRGTKVLKRKEVPAVIPSSETPKLFSSSFKVPKLKTSSGVNL